MGRLFWKFFISIWIAQVIGTVSVMTALKIKHGETDAPGPQAIIAAQAATPRKPPRELSYLPPEPLVAHLVASLIVASLLAHYFSRPIRSLRAAFQNAASGNLSASVGHVVAKRHDELSDLLTEFDRMAWQLHVLMESQRRLLHDVSHEVRSPLARMQAAVGLARQQPDKAAYLLDRIEREIVRIDALVGELLTLARLEAGEPGALDEELCIDGILADIMDNAQFEAQANGKTFHMSGHCGAVVAGNAALLRRALENVVRNAIRHTADGSGVTLESGLDAAANTVVIAVCDHGPGVPDAELGAIFKPFFRGATGALQDGHGLGLAIAAQIMKVHHGSVRASNRPQGGLCVEFVIPAARGVRDAGGDNASS